MWWCARTSCKERLMAARLKLQPRQESWSLFIYFLAISFSITRSQKRIAPSPAPSNQRVEGTFCPRSWRPPHSSALSPSSVSPTPPGKWELRRCGGELLAWALAAAAGWGAEPAGWSQAASRASSQPLLIKPLCAWGGGPAGWSQRTSGGQQRPRQPAADSGAIPSHTPGPG